jgi:hypothetical protein
MLGRPFGPRFFGADYYPDLTVGAIALGRVAPQLLVAGDLRITDSEKTSQAKVPKPCLGH